jgi:hypothetical protein
LSNYLDWSKWLTVDVGVANVSQLTFYSPYNTHGAGFWPSIDTMDVNESANPIPEPGSLALLGLGLGGLALAAWRRKK